MSKLRLISGRLDKNIDTEDNCSLLEVIQKHGFFLEAPCGGRGTCKKCTVLIDNKPHLACQTRVRDGMTVTLPDYDNLAIGDNKERLLKRLGGIDIAPVIKRVEIEIASDKRNSYISDLDYLKELLKQKGFVEISISWDKDLFTKIGELTHKNTTVTVYLFEQKDRVEIVDLLEGGNRRNLAVAIDLGTTTVSLVLLDTEKGEICDSITFYNPQIVYGADIIQRILFSFKNNGLKPLQEKVTTEIRQSIEFLALKENLSLDEIKYIVLSGNMTMVHFFLGLPSRFIKEAPYSPVVKDLPVINDCLNLINKGRMFIMPCPANYLGGDLVSGSVSCDLHKSRAINILLDIGTNGEIIVASRDWLIGCACSAGPAFEGMGLNCGTRYKQGAITDVRDNKGELRYVIAGGRQPCGISGSGIISLIKHLKEKGYIDNRGKFTDKVTDKIGHRKAFILFKPEQSESGQPIYIDETDIDNILRAKAAIYSGISLILKKLSLDLNRINKLFVAGNLGSSLNIDNAQEIGLLPPLAKDKIVFLGNASLAGAVRYLLSKETREAVPQIAAKTTYVDLSNEPDYMDEFIAALFIPHTNMDLFEG
ncbi:MAG: ASKHA domain-containing protein [Candidatus Omnitrophota bacterium]